MGYIAGMQSDDVLLRAEFNPRIRQYTLVSIGLVLLLSVVTIPILIVWLAGWGQWVSRKHYESLTCDLTARHLRFSKGHFFKTELTFIDNPVLRWFELRILKVETAGNSAAQDADMKLVGIMDAAGFKEQVMAARDRFQNARHQGVAVAAPAGDDVVTALRDIHTSLEGLRQELRERG